MQTSSSMLLYVTQPEIFSSILTRLPHKNTAFEALHRGTLHALRIPFMGDPDVNADSLELWSFRVIYKQSPEGGREIQGLEANLGNEETFDPSLCVSDLLLRVEEQCKTLPQLPGEMHIDLITIHLLG